MTVPGDSAVLPHSAMSPNLEQAMLTTVMTAVLSTLGTNKQVRGQEMAGWVSAVWSTRTLPFLAPFQTPSLY